MKLILEHRMVGLAGILGSGSTKNNDSTQRTMDEMIREAISEKKLVSFDYDNFHRIAELHVYGRQSDKNGVLAYQIGGQSSKGDLGWKIMYVNKITNMKVLDEPFPGKRETTGKHTSWDVYYYIVD